jgi:hypothetical protein
MVKISFYVFYVSVYRKGQKLLGGLEITTGWAKNTRCTTLYEDFKKISATRGASAPSPTPLHYTMGDKFFLLAGNVYITKSFIVYHRTHLKGPVHSKKILYKNNIFGKIM